MVDAGAVDALVTSMEVDFDPSVKESAAWALGYIARHNEELSQAVVDAGAVPPLILAVQEPELSLKRISASALSDISKHSPELAQTVVDAGAVAYLSQYIDARDAKLKRQVLSALSQVRNVVLTHLNDRVYRLPSIPSSWLKWSWKPKYSLLFFQA